MTRCRVEHLTRLSSEMLVLQRLFVFLLFILSFWLI